MVPSVMPTVVPTTPAAADNDVGAAVVVIIAAAWVTVITAVVIGGRAYADAHTERPCVKSDLRHCRRRRGRC